LNILLLLAALVVETADPQPHHLLLEVVAQVVLELQQVFL
jgi:hypothetical protein